MASDLHHLLGDIRNLTDGFKAGDKQSFAAFRDLAALLLTRTVAAEGCAPRLISAPGGAAPVKLLAGPTGPTKPLTLRDGRFLKLTVTLMLADTDDGPRLKVRDSSYQYQLDEAGDHWVWRYDYERDADHRHPRSHLHLRGQLAESNALANSTYTEAERIHYPVGRISLEGIIRLLIEQYGCPSASAPEIWKPMLAESEGLFAEIAHQPLAGPEVHDPEHGTPT